MKNNNDYPNAHNTIRPTGVLNNRFSNIARRQIDGSGNDGPFVRYGYRGLSVPKDRGEERRRLSILRSYQKQLNHFIMSYSI